MSDSKVKLIGNGHHITPVMACEVDEKTLRKLVHEFDYRFDGLSDPRECECEFFFYRGNWYDLHDIPAVESYAPAWLRKWDGYINDSYFSGIVIRYVKDEWGDYTGDIQAYTFIA